MPWPRATTTDDHRRPPTTTDHGGRGGSRELDADGAARAAGLLCVGVPSLPHAQLDADLVVASLHDVELLAWVRRW